MAHKKDKLMKELYATRINRILWGKVLEYCIEHNIKLMDLIEDALFEKIGVNKEQVLEEEKRISNQMNKDWQVWIDLLKKQRKLRNQYEQVVRQVKHKKQTVLEKVLAEYSIDDLIKMKEGEENGMRV